MISVDARHLFDDSDAFLILTATLRGPSLRQRLLARLPQRRRLPPPLHALRRPRSPLTSARSAHDCELVHALIDRPDALD